MIYLQGQTKPAGSRIRHSQYPHLTARGPDQGVVREITGNTPSFILKICTNPIYIYPSLILRLQINRVNISRLTKGESGDRLPVSPITMVPTIAATSQRKIGTRFNFHLARNRCPIAL